MERASHRKSPLRVLQAVTSGPKLAAAEQQGDGAAEEEAEDFDIMKIVESQARATLLEEVTTEGPKLAAAEQQEDGSVEDEAEDFNIMKIVESRARAALLEEATEQVSL